MSSGTHGMIAYKKTKVIKMKKLEPVAKIVVFQAEKHDWLGGFRFLAKTGEVLLEVGSDYYPGVEFQIEDGERILGIRSRLHQQSDQDLSLNHSDLQFIIGKIDF